MLHKSEEILAEITSNKEKRGGQQRHSQNHHSASTLGTIAPGVPGVPPAVA
jgi:hypothetical protein